MMNTLLEKIFADFDDYNAKDPSMEVVEGKELPKELIYGRRMTEKLNQYHPDAPLPLQIAARCQHIGRWEIPRSTYPMDKVGYIRWRNELKTYHAGIAERILQKYQVDQETIDRVKYLLQKKNLKNDADTQTLEDVICLVFLENYLEEFAVKHDDEKIVDILVKTWNKMSPKAHDEALKIDFSDRIKPLIVRFMERLNTQRDK
jgi:hypothetical protein